MNLHKTTFQNLSDSQKRDKRNEVYLKTGEVVGDFEVIFKRVKKEKSWEQVKGIHKLCDLLAPRFSESYGTPFDMEAAKLHIKWQFDYLRAATYEEALSVAIEEREKLKALGKRMSIKEFNSLVKSLQDTLKKPKSFADATVDEMSMLIEQVHLLAEKMDWSEVRLEPYEFKQMLEFYNLKEK
jgi:hypothetical protein